MSNRRKMAVLAIGLGMSAVFLWLSFRKVEFGDVVGEIAKVNVAVLSLNLVLKFLNFNVAATRARLLFRDLRPFGHWRMFKSMLLAFSVNNIIPFRAGEFARLGYLSKHGELPASSVLAVIAIERATDLFVLAVMFITIIPLAATGIEFGMSVYIGLGGALSAMAVAVVVSRNPARFVAVARFMSALGGRTIQNFVAARANTFAEGLTGLRTVGAVVAVMGLTIVFWSVSCLGLNVLFWACGISLPWYASVVVMAFLTVGMAVPATPGNIGVFHFATVYAMTTLGVAESAASSFSVVAHAVTTIPFTLIAIPVLFSDTRR